MKYALITGATRGIGLACCKKFSKEGFVVTGLWSKDQDSFLKAKESLPNVRFVKADVSDENAVRQVFEKLPSLDVLVNNAGIQQQKQVQDIALAEWDRIMAVNAGGVFLCTKYAVKKMLAREGGAIINISSIWGEIGGSCESAYSASKGAVIAFTKAVAKELAPASILVNCVSPGAIETSMNAMITEEDRRELVREIPLGRFGTPEEVAELVFFLSGQKYITGQNIAINGGWDC